MVADHASETEQPTYEKTPGSQPLPGYVLIEPLGRGGFGEVWKCEAPGGLHKAVKFVSGRSDSRQGDGSQLRQEYEAFQQVKTIRHPFLLPLERVELVDNELVMVMGLADRHIGERFQECRSAGLPGIPREELLGYLREAAEALDVIGAKYGLQHLDVKPANLFLTAGHVQVGDYGLITKLDEANRGETNRGLTPKYASPEVLRGAPHTRSDQYSLALVYQELLTGTFPYPGRTPQQIMLQHVSATPDLTGLAERDRPPVAQALAKSPEDRFPSCRDFIVALAKAGVTRVTLIAPTPPKPAPPPPPPRPAASEPARPQADDAAATLRLHPPAPAAAAPAGVQLPDILSVVPVDWLRARQAPDPDIPPGDMVRLVLAAAGGRPTDLIEASSIARLSGGAWESRFLTTIDPRVAKVKLDLLWEEGGIEMDTREPNRVVFRQPAPAKAAAGGVFGLFAKKQPSGLEVVVNLPDTRGAVGEVVASGQLFGTPPPDFTQTADQTIVRLLEGVRRQLNNTQNRRKHQRFPADFGVTLYPVLSAGRVGVPLSGRCLDVSAGGLALRTTIPPPGKHLYVAFDEICETAGLALLVQMVQIQPRVDGIHVACRFRLDLWPEPPE